jgi:DNA-directed RNA polymerase sigma subunit (sigma70/sigma32)
MNSVCRFDNEETGNSLEDTLEQGTFPAPWEAVEREQMRAALSHVLASLDDRERFIVESLFGMRCGEDEDAPDLRGVGDAISLSHERVRNIRDKAIDRLKKRMHKYLNIVE